MKAIVVRGTGAQAHLAQEELPPPVPEANDLLVKVAFAGLNRAELNLSGNDHVKGGHVLGSELAGKVVAMGSACSGFAMGDRVMGLGRGSHAELACIDHRLAMNVPPDLDLSLAAALPACYMTAHNALCTEASLQPGEIVLVQGATSGVGIAAVQLARYFGASRVIGVGRDREKLARLREAGLDHDIVWQDGWPDTAVEASGGGANVIIDMVGGGALAGNLASAALKGRIVAVGRLGGQTDILDINTLAFKRLRLIGVSFRSRTIEERSLIAQAFVREVLPAIAEGRLRPVIFEVFPFGRIEYAHQTLRQNAHFGKAILEVGP